jgi:hypothetical protein
MYYSVTPTAVLSVYFAVIYLLLYIVLYVYALYIHMYYSLTSTSSYPLRKATLRALANKSWKSYRVLLCFIGNGGDDDGTVVFYVYFVVIYLLLYILLYVYFI